MEGASDLVPGVDYPRTFQEVDEWFRSDAACREYIRRLRWPNGFICPHCGWTGEPWMTSRGLLHCQACQGQTSLTAGTIFQDTRKPLRMWFMAMWYITNQKNGVSALGLQRVLGLGSYETAWTWLHKLRRAMVRPGRDALSGTVEVDETYVGGVERGKRGRNTETKAIVAVAAEENGKGHRQDSSLSYQGRFWRQPSALRSVSRGTGCCDPHRRLERLFRADGRWVQT